MTELPLAKLVDQYLDIIELLKELDLGDVGDFIDLASTLVELKSQAVLPKIVEESEEERSPIRRKNWSSGCCNTRRFVMRPAILDEMGHRWQQRYERCRTICPVAASIPATSRSSIWKSGI